MRHNGEGFGCMPVVGLLWLVAAVCGLGWGALAGVEGIVFVIPWCIACVAIGMFILSVADARTRIAMIEKHLGINASTDPQNNQDDAHTAPDDPS
jgi:hypothetical protein